MHYVRIRTPLLLVLFGSAIPTLSQSGSAPTTATSFITMNAISQISDGQIQAPTGPGAAASSLTPPSTTAVTTSSVPSSLTSSSSMWNSTSSSVDISIVANSTTLATSSIGAAASSSSTYSPAEVPTGSTTTGAAVAVNTGGAISPGVGGIAAGLGAMGMAAAFLL